MQEGRSAINTLNGHRDPILLQVLTLTCYVTWVKALEISGPQNWLFAEVLGLRPSCPWFERQEECYYRGFKGSRKKHTFSLR